MHHPGQPRFVAVGEAVELAPRAPDPAATYRWQVERSPEGSEVTVGNEPVEELVPDVPGTYRVVLDAPDGTHQLTVRAFPAPEREAAVGGSGESGRSGGRDEKGDSEGYATDSGSEGGRPRIRLDGAVEGDELVVRATVKTAPGSDVPDSTPDVEFVVDDRDGIETDLSVEGHEARVPSGAVGDLLRIHAVAVGEEHSVADELRIERTAEEFSIARPNEVPDWVREATIYEVYLRSATEPDGTSFEQLTERLDHIEGLGIDCIWLTPILAHDGAAHGYNIVDFFSIADDLGSRESFERFVEAAHDRGIRVLFDLVLNHSARSHPFFEAATDPDHPEHDSYREWYEFDDEGEPASYFGWYKVVNFDLTTLAVRDHLLSVVDEWAPLVDGFRCDMAWALPEGLWKEIRARVKAEDGGFLMLDETIPYIADLHEGAFDLHFDTTLYFYLRQIGHGDEPASAVLDAVDQRARVGFPDHAAFMTYVENHDETRYREECGYDEMLAATAATFTVPGVPMLYAGQELGTTNRRDSVDFGTVDRATYEHVRSLVRARSEVDALGFEAELVPVEYDSPSEGVVAFGREGAGESAIVVLNFGPGSAPVTIGERFEPTELVSGAEIEVEPTAEGSRIEVGSVAVFER